MGLFDSSLWSHSDPFFASLTSPPANFPGIEKFSSQAGHSRPKQRGIAIATQFFGEA
jgi:hypothetical protein